MALGSTRPVREMSTKSIPGGKGGRCVRLTTLPPSCAVVMKSGNLNLLEPSGPFQACNIYIHMLRRIFGCKRDEVTREWRKLQNEELNDLHSSPNIVRMIKSRTRLAGHVARMGRGEGYTGFYWGNLRERDSLGDPGVGRRIILRWIFRK